jgi:hypothetical protein
MRSAPIRSSASSSRGAPIVATADRAVRVVSLVVGCRRSRAPTSIVERGHFRISASIRRNNVPNMGALWCRVREQDSRHASRLQCGQRRCSCLRGSDRPHGVALVLVCGRHESWASDSARGRGIVADSIGVRAIGRFRDASSRARRSRQSDPYEFRALVCDGIGIVGGWRGGRGGGRRATQHQPSKAQSAGWCCARNGRCSGGRHSSHQSLPAVARGSRTRRFSRRGRTRRAQINRRH